MARNYFILLISFLGAVALADYAIVTGLVDFQTSVENPQSPDSSILYKLAQKYEAGVEVELDMDKAIYWYQVAAKNGSEEAKNRLLALNIPLSKSSTSLQGDEKNKQKLNEIDQEAQKITKLLEKQLAREEEKRNKSKKNKAQNVQYGFAEGKKEAQRIRQLEEENLKNTSETRADSELDSADLDSEVATIKPRSKKVSSSNDISKTVNTTTKATIPVPLALQPARPLNLPSTQKPDTSIPNNDPSEQLTAYGEETNTENANKEFTENENISSSKEVTQGEKKEFNVNPCNGPAAKFMSTCR